MHACICVLLNLGVRPWARLIFLCEAVLTKRQLEKIQATQREMERKICQIRKINKITNNTRGVQKLPARVWRNIQKKFQKIQKKKFYRMSNLFLNIFIKWIEAFDLTWDEFFYSETGEWWVHFREQRNFCVVQLPTRNACPPRWSFNPGNRW